MTVPVDAENAPKLNVVDQLKMQNAQFLAQKEAAQTNLNQLVGAIYATDIAIKKLEKEAENVLPLENSGEEGNGDTDKQEPGQTSEE
jgi:hypothetical protein